MCASEFAPWLADALRKVLSDPPAVVDPAPSGIAGALGPSAAHLLPTLAKIAARNPQTLPPKIRQAAAAAAQRTATAEDAVRELLAPLAEGLEDRDIRWVAMGQLHLLAGLDPGPEWPAGDRLELLLSPLDMARARLLMISEGITPRHTTRAGDRVVYERAGVRLAVRCRLTRVGWATLPLQPFFDNCQTIVRAGVEVPVMEPAAARSASLLLAAANLFDPVTTDPLQLAELALLPDLISAERWRWWTERVPRWGVGRLWRRALAVEAWLMGDVPPPWMDPGLGEPSRFGAESESSGGRGSLGAALALQDGPRGWLRLLASRLRRG